MLFELFNGRFQFLLLGYEHCTLVEFFTKLNVIFLSLLYMNSVDICVIGHVIVVCSSPIQLV